MLLSITVKEYKLTHFAGMGICVGCLLPQVRDGRDHLTLQVVGHLLAVGRSTSFNVFGL